MFLGESPRNAKEIRATLDKMAKRKGKPVKVPELRDGDLILSDNRLSLNLVELEEKDGKVLCTIGDARAALLPHGIGVRSVLHRPLSEVPQGMLDHYRLVGRKEDYPQPDLPPVIKTFYHHNEDGSICGQNFIMGYRGQHFRVSEEKWAGIATDPAREAIPENGPCPECHLIPGECEEYDGHKWRMEGKGE